MISKVRIRVNRCYDLMDACTEQFSLVVMYADRLGPAIAAELRHGIACGIDDIPVMNNYRRGRATMPSFFTTVTVTIPFPKSQGMMQVLDLHTLAIAAESRWPAQPKSPTFF
jgi:hypothetical protein